MQEVCPCLGKIFPWVSTGVGTDEPHPPIGGRPFRIVCPKCLIIILPLVAEAGPERSELPVVPHQAIPVIMCYFMPEMAQQCAIRFTEIGAPLFTDGIVGFSQIQRNHAILMASLNQTG